MDKVDLSPEFLSSQAIYLTGEEWLRVTAFNTQAGVTLRIAGRVLPFGAVHPVPFLDTLTPTSDGLATAKLVALPDGWLFSVMVSVTAGAPSVGQTYVVVELVRGGSANAEAVMVLAADYVTAQVRAAYPGTGVKSTSSYAAGVPVARIITGATPAAGAEVSETVPTGKTWQLVSFHVRLVTSATVATRVPYVVIDDGTTPVFQVPCPATVVANTTVDLFWSAIGAQVADAAVVAHGGMLPVETIITATHRLRTSTGSIQVGDQYSLVRYLVREF